MTCYLNRNGLLACRRSSPLPSPARLSRPWTVQQRSHSCTQPLLPPRLTIARAARLFRLSKLTSNQLCQHSYNLAFFGENSLHLNSYAKLLPLEQILQQACQSDERIRNGNSKGLLDGIPVTIKANIAVGKYWEMPNACSAILSLGEEELRDACTSTSDEGEGTSNNPVYESDIARRLLKDCGAVLIGITNMDEFGMGSLGVNNGLRRGDAQQKRYPPTYNPVPWMHRLASLLSNQHRPKRDAKNDDDYWLDTIRNSTPENPHGIGDEKCLAELREEVQHWIRGGNNCQDGKMHFISPGGSSSGAAVTASHGSSLLSIGTDTGGSLRLPSAWTSTVGFKPSYGTFSRYGVVSYVSSLDTIGFITGTSECAEIAWRCLMIENKGRRSDGGISCWNAQISRDSTARVYHNESKHFDQDSHILRVLDQPKKCGVEAMMAGAEKPLANIRVGIPSAFSLQETPPSIAAAWSESARSLQNDGGATIVAISESKLPPTLIKLALASYYVLACAEASSNLSRYDGLRFGANVNLDALPDEHDAGFGPLCGMTALEHQISANRVLGFGDEIQRRVLAGTSVLSSDRFHTHYEAAAVARAKISRSLDKVFRSSLEQDEDDDKVDVILVPTALTFPPDLSPNGDGVQLTDPTAAFANDVMTIPISLGGFPSISVPVNVGRLNSKTDCSQISFTSMIGMQVFASKGSDDLVLRVANALQ